MGVPLATCTATRSGGGLGPVLDHFGQGRVLPQAAGAVVVLEGLGQERMG